MLKPIPLGPAPNLFLTSLTFNNSLHQISHGFTGCEALLAALKKCPKLERLSIMKFQETSTFLRLLMQAVKECRHCLKSFTLLRELCGLEMQDTSCGFLEEFDSLTRLEEITIDCGLLLYNLGQPTVGRLPNSIQKVHLSGMTRLVRSRLLSWLEELATTRLAGGLPHLKIITCSIPGDHIAEQASFNNYLSVEYWVQRKLKKAGINFSRGIERTTGPNKPQVTGSEEIVEEWKDDISEEIKDGEIV
jgi:hypothetical protein